MFALFGLVGLFALFGLVDLFALFGLVGLLGLFGLLALFGWALALGEVLFLGRPGPRLPVFDFAAVGFVFLIAYEAGANWGLLGGVVGVRRGLKV